MRLFLFLSLFFTISCEGYIARHSIVGTADSENSKRVITYHDYHGLQDTSQRLIALDKRQSNSIIKHSCNGSNGQKCLFLVEETEHQELYKRILSSWDKARNSDISNKRDHELLSLISYKLSDGESLKCVDRGIAIKDIIRLSYLFIDPAKKDNQAINALRNEFSTFDLSVNDALLLFDSVFSDTYRDLQVIASLVKSKENKAYFAELISDFLPIKESIKKSAFELSKYGFTQWFELLNKKPFLVEQLIKELASYFFTEESPPKSMWLMDSYTLATLLSPECPPNVYIAVGMLHGQKIHDVLVKEGYHVLYDSYIKMDDGFVFEDAQEAIYYISMTEPQAVDEHYFSYGSLEKKQLQNLFKKLPRQRYADEL